MTKKFLFTSLAAILLITVLFITCSKEYSYEGGPSAVFTFDGSPTACTMAKVNGFYFKGRATDSNNTVQVSVNVTTIGNYIVYTNGVHGIFFLGTGSFADTGKNIVTLNCSGVPDSLGTYAMQIQGDNACYFNVEVTKRAPSVYVLSGSPGDCSSPEIKGVFTAGTEINYTNSLKVKVNVSIPGDYTIKTSTQDGISFSASGYFSATGEQSVTLTGSGTPDSPGLIFFNVQANSSQCGFGLPVVSAFPPATYVLQSGFGSPNPCTPQSIQGTYTAGIPLNSSNTATISVYVKVLGNYAVSTGRINGIAFGTSGTFTMTGEQDIILSGRGVPSLPGTFSFSPFIIGPAPLGGETCAFNIPVK